MNPRLVTELDREGAAILRLIDAIPRGREHDMTGHLDAKRAVACRLAKLMKRWREAGAGMAAERPAAVFSGPVQIARRRVRHVEVHGA